MTICISTHKMLKDPAPSWFMLTLAMEDHVQGAVGTTALLGLVA